MSDRGRFPPRELLLIAQLTPPSELIAARRVAGLAKYLPRLDQRVTVVTSKLSGEGAIEGAEEVFRTRDLLAGPLNWRRRHFEALGGGGSAEYKPPSKLQSAVVPDLALFGWIPFALAKAVALARKRRFDCVLTTSPPPSTHFIGMALKRRYGTPWVAEFRDGWTFEPPAGSWPKAWQRSLDRRLERAVVRSSDGVVAVTQPIVDDFRERLGVDARLITNGFDPDLASTGDDGAGLDPRRHSFVHTGRMAVTRSSPAPLLDALRVLRADAPDVFGKIEVVFAGPLTKEEQALISAPDLGESVRWVGALGHERSVALQRAADTLVVVTEGSTRRSVATGKLFEYLAARRPILVLGDGTEAARIVSQAGVGTTTSATDPAQIAAAVRSLVEEGQRTVHGDVDRYAYPVIAEQLAVVIDEICHR